MNRHKKRSTFKRHNPKPFHSAQSQSDVKFQSSLMSSLLKTLGRKGIR